MVQRIPPQDDEAKRRLIQQQKLDLQKVKEVEEANADSRSKQRFKAFMQPEDEDEIPADQAPSPYEIQPTSSKGLTNAGIDPNKAIPSPSYSPVPNPNVLPASPFELYSDATLPDDDLPQGFEFYQSSDMTDPYGESSNPPSLEEELSSPSKGPKSKTTDRVSSTTAQTEKEKAKSSLHRGPASPPQKGKQIEPSLYGPPGKAATTKPFPTAPSSKQGGISTPGKKNTPDELAQASGRYWAPEEKIQAAPPSTISPKKEPERKITGTSNIDALGTKAEEKKAEVKPFEPVAEKLDKESTEKESKDGSGKKEVKKERSEITPASLTPLPAQVQPMAQAAAVAAAPYLSPEVLAQYAQIVGTIFILTQSKGVSKTEFLLNHPAFANSKFFGSSIEVTRYSTAPDAFNIRLSGSPEAVNAFNQSIPSLLTAFQNGHFKFRINRIEAQHSSPVFHRKKGGQNSEGSNKEGNSQ